MLPCLQEKLCHGRALCRMSVENLAQLLAKQQRVSLVSDLFHLGKRIDMLVLCQMKSGYIVLQVTSLQVTSEHLGPSTNWKGRGNHTMLICFWYRHKWFKLGIAKVYLFFNSISSKQAWKGKTKNAYQESVFIMPPSTFLDSFLHIYAPPRPLGNIMKLNTGRKLAQIGSC